MSKLESIGNMIEYLVKRIILVFTAALVSMVFLQVVLRYVFSTNIVWIEELERYTFVWLMFLGIILGVYRQKHIAITATIEKLRKYIKNIEVLPHYLTGIFFIVLTWVGLKFVIEGFSGFASVLPISLGYIYLIIPVSSLFAVIFTIILIARAKEANKHD